MKRITQKLRRIILLHLGLITFSDLSLGSDGCPMESDGVRWCLMGPTKGPTKSNGVCLPLPERKGILPYCHIHLSTFNYSYIIINITKIS